MTHELGGGYIMTASGQCVGETGAPTLDDIILALGRAPRFGGHSREPWTVLQHSLFVHALARRAAAYVEHWGSAARAVFFLHALLHDAHEAVTADVPSPFKSASLKMFQRKLDQRIARALVPEEPQLFLRDVIEIQRLDHEALLAEALLVGPPKLTCSEIVEAHFGGKPALAAVQTLDKERTKGYAAERFRFWYVRHRRVIQEAQ